MTSEPEPTTMAASDLTKLRQLAGDYVFLWPEGVPFTHLQPANQDRVRQLSRNFQALIAESQASGPERTNRRPSARRHEDDFERIDPSVERQVGVGLDALTDLFTLTGIKGFGPQKFKQLLDAGVKPGEAVAKPSYLPLMGKTGALLRSSIEAVSYQDRELARQRAARQIVAAAESNASILTYEHPAYPRNVLHSNNAIPVLYARGDASVLMEQRTVACVGSRQIRPPYSDLQRHFAQFLTRSGSVVVSGFAVGADTVAHEAAVEVGGATICVMPGGLDRPFPPENKQLFARFVDRPGVVFLSEFPFGTGASSMNLRKRNKLIVAAALGVLVGQSSSTGGAMNAFKFALEQRKPVATFEFDGTPETTGNLDIAHSAKGRTRSFPQRLDLFEWESWLSEL